MTEAATTSVHTLRLGTELRQIRRDLDLTLRQAHERTKRSTSSLSRIEKGQVRLPERDLPPILDAYGVTDPARREELLSLARDAYRKDWWDRYGDVLTCYPDFISLENAATSIRTFQCVYVHGLLQIREYAYALFEHFQQGKPRNALKRLTDVRMTRQEILERKDPPDFHVLIGEGALRQLVGGPAVMRRQLHHLSQVARYGRPTIQVLPFSAGAHAASGSFTLLTVPAFGRGIVNIDGDAGRAVLDDPDSVEHYRLVFERLRSSVLDEEASLALIERMAAELE